MDGALTNAELEGRLAAQRQVLQWLLSRVVTTPSDLAALHEHLDLELPPSDHQEDPGAVPALGFATATAASIELRALLDHLSIDSATPRDQWE